MARSLLLTFALAVLLPAAAQTQIQSGVPANPDMIVSADRAAELMREPNTLVLHVSFQPSEEWIPDAVYLAYASIAEMEGELPVELPPVEALATALGAAGVSNDTHVILYSDGSPHMAARAFMTLDYLGHGDRTSVLDGGMRAWKASGRPTVNAPTEPQPATFVPRPRQEILVNAEWIVERLDDPSVTLIDARPENEYTGEREQEGLRGGHIPGAYNLYFMDLVRSDEDPAMIPLAEVRARFEEAGADAGETVVSYCYVGMRASYTYLISRYLGYDAKFYDASWAEWGARVDLPLGGGGK